LYPGGAVGSALPPDATEAINKFEQQKAQTLADAHRRVAEERQALIQQLRELQDRYTKAGQLDQAVAVRDRIRQMEGETGTGEVIPDPGNAVQFRGQEHRTFRVAVTGQTEGSIWGTGPFTDDSSIATAAVMAGILRPGERGVVRITILPGQDSYPAATINGVTSLPYAQWPGSYSISPDGGAAVVPVLPLHNYGPAPAALPDPGTLSSYRSYVGGNFVFKIVGSTQGTIWGCDTYTDDSPLAVAAVHAGIVAPGETKVVKVIILPGQQHYEGCTKNGITSDSWGSWAGSYQIQLGDVAPRPDAEPTVLPPSPRYHPRSSGTNIYNNNASKTWQNQ
jgi:hypothetical protein